MAFGNDFFRSGRFWVPLVLLVLVGALVFSYMRWEWIRSGSEIRTESLETGVITTNTITFESVSSTLRNIGLIVGGIVAVLLAMWRSLVAERQADATLRQAEAADRGLLNDRYQKAADMLGSSVITARLGGIYALQGLAEQHPELYHVQTLRLLCAFLRNPTVDGEGGNGQTDSAEKDLREDLQIAVWAISTCHAKHSSFEDANEYLLDLGRVDFRYAYLSRANLSSAILTHANLSSSHLMRANLNSARLDLANLCGANLTGATMVAAKMWHTKAAGANLRQANLSNANLVGVDLSKSHLQQAVLYNALLNGVDFTGADLEHVNLSNARFVSSPVLAHAEAAHANLTGANLQQGDLRHSTLDGADLSSADLVEADLTEASLRRANLSHAYLRGADFSGADLTDANLSGAHLSFEGQFPAMGLKQSQLDRARSAPDNPPKLEGVIDSETGEPLTWKEYPGSANN